MPSAGLLSAFDGFNQVEDTSNYSASVLQTIVTKNMRAITGNGVKSQMLYVSLQSCLLHYNDHYHEPR